EILEILNEIDPDIAYEFLDRFIQAVGEDNISQEINDILNSANEIPSEPVANPSPGTYVGPISVKLKLDKLKVGHSYYYTLDGTYPNKGSEKYRGQIEITESTTIKIIGYNKNDESTEVITLEYKIDKNILEDIKDSIAEGETLIKDTTVGTEIGNISKKDKDKLQLIISEAKDLVNKDSVSHEKVINIKDKIENGIEEFKNNIIKPTDKSKLKSAINEAQNLYNNTTEGSNEGQYKSGSKSILLGAINEAKEVYENRLSKQNDIDNRVRILNNAIREFKNSKVSVFTKEKALQYAINKYGIPLEYRDGDNAYYDDNYGPIFAKTYKFKSSLITEGKKRYYKIMIEIDYHDGIIYKGLKVYDNGTITEHNYFFE
ncbi:MAG: chitobiase/beta-hexosaminidase C-terminal domain-containing protein, partial [Romboutsia timonensis]|uniref:chitobiase/beta-hexosaminidase C-terminal domain-containing protein n=1 Tax=Romboutsia timonensis TaxID=1776391 RepID=UPI002A75085B